MGHRMSDTPHVYGDDCLAVFERGKTPKYVYVRFSGIVTCPGSAPIAPNDRVFKLTQDPENPCAWYYYIAPWYVYFWYVLWPDLTQIGLLEFVGAWEYFDRQEAGHANEGYVFGNDLAECYVGRGGSKGIAVVTWTQQATALLEAINMQRADDLFMEMRPLADGNLIYKFCRKWDATNIAIKYKPD